MRGSSSRISSRNRKSRPAISPRCASGSREEGSMASETFAAWLLTVAVHATVLLGIAWLADRGALRSRPAWREILWRAAFFGAVVTASVQVLLQTPTHARIALATRAHE